MKTDLSRNKYLRNALQIFVDLSFNGCSYWKELIPFVANPSILVVIKFSSLSYLKSKIEWLSGMSNTLFQQRAIRFKSRFFSFIIQMQ